MLLLDPINMIANKVSRINLADGNSIITFQVWHTIKQYTATPTTVPFTNHIKLGLHSDGKSWKNALKSPSASVESRVNHAKVVNFEEKKFNFCMSEYWRT